jgi:hypothetical protein
MITLSSQYVTTAVSTINGVATTTTTDHLKVSYIEISFDGAGSIRAKIQRGTLTYPAGFPSVAAVFVPNMKELWVNVNANGSFASQDGTWKGAAGSLNVAALLEGLTAALDGALLASGAVSGTEVTV